ncbi:hypothetical protein BCD67_15800 [Oscillatoriales cyanobacterium USR001]|nr:hypothetical protein BCD67_15800 [Oscillatoriales cyanobacterium USR001]
MKACDKPLKSNPFTTCRDPQTGKWIVIKPEPQKNTDSGKSRCLPNIAIAALGKHLESQVEIVAA